ncbi:MAG: hypothetical protein ACE15D_10595 [Candidatus Eisenbacteria bacterium]
MAVAAAFAAVLSTGVARATEPASTAFTYQGQLTQAGIPADGVYEFEFRLYDAPAEGNLVASIPGPYPATVTEGLFTARLDFGDAAFTGLQLWLEMGVRPEGDPGPFTILSPRQELSATPYASVALNSPFLRAGSGLYYEGRMALGSDQPPVGILDVVGPPHDATVILPNNAISSAECLDEPGISGAFATGEVWFTSAPVTLRTASIECPGPGYVLALGSTDLSGVAYSSAGGYVGIENTADPGSSAPPDARWVIFGDDMPSIYYSCPVSVNKVFPVTAGNHTFYLRGWRGFGDNSPRANRAGLTLLFIPSAYGALPL